MQHVGRRGETCANLTDGYQKEGDFMKNTIIGRIGMLIVLGPLGGLVSDVMIARFGGGAV